MKGVILLGNLRNAYTKFMWGRIDFSLGNDYAKHPEVLKVLGKIELTDKGAYQAIMDYVDSVAIRVYRQGIKDGVNLAGELGVAVGE